MIKLLNVSLLLCCFLFVSSCGLEEELLELEGEWRLDSATLGPDEIDYGNDVTMMIVEDNLTLFFDGERVLEADVRYEKGKNLDALSITVNFREPAANFIFAFSDQLIIDKKESNLTLYENCGCPVYNFERV